MKLPPAVAFNVSIASLNSLAASRVSCDSINPAASASAPSWDSASAPPKIKGFRSCAFFPNISIASASRSVSFATSPNFWMTSSKTAWLSLSCPLLSTIVTPKVSKASATAPVPSFAVPIPFVSLAIELVSVSRGTSIRSDAYMNFWISSVDRPVCFARVFISSAAMPAFTPMPTSPASAPPAAAERGIIALPAPVTFPPNSCMSSPAFFKLWVRDPPKSLAAFSTFLSSCSVFIISLCKALYCSSDASPLLTCSWTCFSASLSWSSFSLVVDTLSANSFCF